MKGRFVIEEGDLVPGFVAEQMKMLLVQMLRNGAPGERAILVCDTSMPSFNNVEHTAGMVLASMWEREEEHSDARPIADLVEFMEDVTGKPGVPYEVAQAHEGDCGE